MNCLEFVILYSNREVTKLQKMRIPVTYNVTYALV